MFCINNMTQMSHDTRQNKSYSINCVGEWGQDGNPSLGSESLLGKIKWAGSFLFFRNLHFFNLVPFLLKIFSLDATFKSVGDVNNVYAFQKKQF